MSLLSEVVTITAPVLTAVWVHDPAEPQDTIRAFPYGEGRASARDIVGNPLTFAGRELPVWDFGPHSTRTVQMNLLILFDHDWTADIDYLTALVESRRAWVYRDDRARLIYGVASQLPETDEPFGTSVGLAISATQFDEAV